MIRLRYQIMLIFLAVWIVFANGLSAKFVMDDASLVVSNPRVHSLAYLPAVFLGSAFFDPLHPDQNSGGQFYRPLVSLAYALIYTLGGPTPWVFHFFQVLLHFTNTVLVLFIFRKFLQPRISFWLALIFAVHPINQLAVIYISSLNDILFLFFGLLGFYALISSRLTLPRLTLVSALLFLSLLSKETGVLFVILCAVYLWLWQRPRLVISGYVFSYFLLAYFFLRFVLARVTYIRIPDIPIMRADLTHRLLTLPRIFWYYLSTFFFPARLVAAQWWLVPKADFSMFFLPLLADLGVLAVIFFTGRFIYRCRRRDFRPFIFFSLWFLVGLGLHLQLWPLDWTVLDTWFYFPQIGLLALLGLVFHYLRPKYDFIFLIVILALGTRTIVRNFDWRDGITLFTHDLRYEDNGYMEASLAGELMAAGRYRDSVPHWQKALALNPWGTPSWYNLGYAYEQLGDYRSAARNYAHFLTLLDPPMAYAGLLTAQLKGHFNDSKSASVAASAVAKYPRDARLWLLKSLVDYSLGDAASASSSAAVSYSLSPSSDALYVEKQIQSRQPVQLSP